MNYLLVAEDQVPWGHLNLVDFGAGGYRSIAEGTDALACRDIRIGDAVEINGRNIHRTGAVAEKGEYLREGDGDYLPCTVAARVEVGTRDSGGGVLVRGLPGGAPAAASTGCSATRRSRRDSPGSASTCAPRPTATSRRRHSRPSPRLADG